MLHAVNHRKAKLSAFKSAGSRVPLEDVVTSTVFGSLTFMRAEDRRFIVSRLFPGFDGTPSSPSEDVILNFWPKMPLSASGFRERYVEPDFTIADLSGRLCLIEVKWGAPLSDLELSSQWLSLEPAKRKVASHVLLVLEPSAYQSSVARCRKALLNAGEETWNPSIRSWRDIADQCRLISIDTNAEPGVRHWARLVHAFLRRESPGSMLGWDNIEMLGLGQIAPKCRLWKPLEAPPLISWSVQ